MELGQTTVASDLIPGSPANARFGATEWKSTAEKALEARDAFAKLDDAGTWTGAANERYVERFNTQLLYWQNTSDWFTVAANALDNYANALEWAQSEAAHAIELWDAAEAQGAAAQGAAALVEYQQKIKDLRRGQGMRHVEVDVPFVDPSGPAHQEAKDVLLNARYQLDVLATEYANTIGEASNAAPLPLTPEQIQQAALNAVVFATVDVAVVQPFLSTLYFLGGVLENLLENADIIAELLAGIFGVAVGGAGMIGGGLALVVSGGTLAPIAVPAIGAGAAVAGAGAGVYEHGAGRWMNEASAMPERRPGVDRGDGRDYGGRFAPRDPNSPPRDYELAEEQGVKDVEDELEVNAIRDKVNVQYPGSPQKGGRYYDAFFSNGDGTYTAIEVKSGRAWAEYQNERISTQRQFDNAVSPENPAIGVYKGKEIRITHVIGRRVE